MGRVHELHQRFGRGRPLDTQKSVGKRKSS
jgi:hypothetical protein